MLASVTSLGVLFFGLLALIAVLFVGFVIYALAQPPRFLRLALGLSAGVLVFLVAGLVVGTGMVLTGSSGATFGSAIQVGMPGDDHVAGVRVSGPLTQNGSGNQDVVRDRWIRHDYGKGAFVDNSRHVTVSAEHLSVGEWASAIGAIALWFLGAIAWVWSLRTILSRAAGGSPFATGNVRSLRVMAACTLLLGVAVPVVQHVVVLHFIRRAGGQGSIGWGLGLKAIGLAVVLLALGEVWRSGVEMREDVEATV